MPPQWIIPEGSPYSRGPSLRLDSLAALILDGRWRWVRQAVQASAASYGESCRPIGTSNGAGSRADSSRGPWSSAELAPRPVRRGRSKPQKNALDSRKMRGMQSWIPGVGRGLRTLAFFFSKHSKTLIEFPRVVELIFITREAPRAAVRDGRLRPPRPNQSGPAPARGP